MLRQKLGFYRWQQREQPSDASFEAFTSKGGPWQKLCKAQRNRRYRKAHADGRDRSMRRLPCRLLPCETAAINSTTPMDRSKTLLLDRMPCRAIVEPLTNQASLFETFVRGKEVRHVRDHRDGGQKRQQQTVFNWAAAPTAADAAAPIVRAPSAEERATYLRLCSQNVTCFSSLEVDHPINFFEQRDICQHCGAERFVTMNQMQCCQGGKLVIDRRMPEPLLKIISAAPGLSKQSRAANDLFRFAQMALPKGTHRIPDSFQHLKVTGIPFAIVPNTNERSSTRSFLDDPNERLEAGERFDPAVRPSNAVLKTIDAVLRSENALVHQLINWSEQTACTARLVLKWPGATTSVRAFTVNPATSVTQPRSIFFTRLDEDEKCYVKSSDSRYAPLMWPLAFPDGEPAVLAESGELLDECAKNLQQATLALMLQPERKADGSGDFVYVPTASPYNPSLPPVVRRFSRLELMGRLGDEVLVDRWLSVVDERLRFLAQKHMQRRFLNQYDGMGDEGDAGNVGGGHGDGDRGPAAADLPETEGDMEDLANGTYLPATEIGTPRHMRHNCSNAMATLRQMGAQYLLFITVTTDLLDWPEIKSRLAQQNPTDPNPKRAFQDPYDRAALHAEAFEAKVQAFLARLRSGTIFRNLGRPTLELEEYEDGHGQRRTLRNYVFPMQTAGGGFLICAVEDQDRGLGHIHIAYRPAKSPPTSVPWKDKPRVNEPMPWVDELVCARIPDDEMLNTFKMVLSAGEARELLGVCKEPPSNKSKPAKPAKDEAVGARVSVHWPAMDAWYEGVVAHQDARNQMIYTIQYDDGDVERRDMREAKWEQLAPPPPPSPPPTPTPTAHAKYTYLNGLEDDAEVLHPDIVADFGYGLDQAGSYDHAVGKAALLTRLQTLVSGTARGGTDSAPDHWSLHPYHRPGGGKLIHKHHGGPCVPDQHCKRKKQSKCKDNYPMPTARFTHMTDDGRINYKRGAADVMVVPFNPWIQLYFTSHINVELVCSPTNVVLYLFKLLKYILKGSDVNRLQLVADGAEQQGQQGAADNSTHRRDQRPNEIRQWRNAKTTCAPYSYRRMAGHTMYIQEPPCEECCVHEPRRRDVKNKRDVALSEWERYLARPCLPGLDNVIFDDYLRHWRSGTSTEERSTSLNDGGAPLTEQDLRDGALCIAKDGRRVYVGDLAKAETLRPNTTEEQKARMPEMHYWRRTEKEASERVVRLLRVPRSAGVRYYIRLLAKHVPARSYDDLRRDPISGCMHESYELACRKRGLLKAETEARDVVMDAIDAQDPGGQLRSLIVQYLVEGFSLSQLLDDPNIMDAVSSDLGYDHAAAYADLDARLGWLSRSLGDYAPQHWSGRVDEVARERQLYADKAVQRALAKSKELQLDTKPGPAEQSEVVRWGLRGARQPGEMAATPDMLESIEAKPPTKLEVAVLQAPAGFGKTRAVKRLAAEQRARGKVVLITASTNLAATNYERGMSTHALALLVGEGEDDEGNVTIKLGRGGRMTPERLALLREADVIVVDEYSGLNCRIIEALIDFLEEHRIAVRLLLVGDKQQIPPVVVGGSREEIVEASILSSHRFPRFHTLELTKPYRQHAGEYADFVRSVGDNTAPTHAGHALNSPDEARRAIALPLVTRVYHEHDPDAQRRAIEATFGVDAETGALDVREDAGFRAILCVRNDLKDEWNEIVNQRRAADSGDPGRLYVASHEHTIEHGGDDGDSLAAEALGEDDMASFQNVDHSVPLGTLTLRLGDAMLLAKTLDKTAGLVKNARVTVAALRDNAVVIRLHRSDAPCTEHTVGRARFVFGLKRNSPLKVIRTQLPLVHAWALTINRSMGQTLERVLFDMRRPPFAHGQGYVAVSRVHVADDLGAFVNDGCSERRADGSRCAILASVTYDELLQSRRCMECDGDDEGDAQTIAPGARPTPRLVDLVPNLDDRATANRRRRRDAVVDERRRARLAPRLDALIAQLDAATSEAHPAAGP